MKLSPILKTWYLLLVFVSHYLRAYTKAQWQMYNLLFMLTRKFTKYSLKVQNLNFTKFSNSDLILKDVLVYMPIVIYRKCNFLNLTIFLFERCMWILQIQLVLHFSCTNLIKAACWLHAFTI